MNQVNPFVYTYEETIRPSDVYTCFGPEDIFNIIRGIGVITAFRPPQVGEEFISDLGNILTYGSLAYSTADMTNRPRLIFERYNMDKLSWWS